VNSNSIKASVLLGGVLAVAAIVRFWGIYFGLPQTECRPDETYVIDIALRFGTGDFNPHTFIYPTLYMYVLFLLYAGYFLVGFAMGKYSSNSDFLLEYVLDPTSFYLIDRFLSALLGTATVLITYHLAKQFLDRKTAIISAFFLALAYLHVRHSHFGVLDVPVTFLIMCSAFFILRAHNDYTSRNYLLAGIFAGLAASTKYIVYGRVCPLLRFGESVCIAGSAYSPVGFFLSGPGYV
jgi:dolichyl-phosphate-mannose--protein O-mannosyl transferase